MKYFPKDYQQARKMFLQAAQQKGAQIQTYECPHSGPDGEKLYTDTALLAKGNEKTILVISSATHGVEGFAGSCIQTGLLSEGFPEKLTKGVAIMVIHAVNPYGYAHLRRFNENNVDVNRNFVDHSCPYPDNKNHAKLAAVLAPKKLGFFSTIRFFATILFCLVCGWKALFKAIIGGQSTIKRSLYYGGENESWSNKTVRSIIKNCTESAEKLIVLDLHTGIGGFGKAVILVNPTHPGSYKQAKKWWPDFKVPDNTNSPRITGPLAQGIYEMLSPEKEVITATVEFGSQKLWQQLSLKALLALRAENWLVHFGGDKHHNHAEIKRNLKDCFCPENEDWQSQVWSRGRTIVHRVLKGIR